MISLTSSNKHIVSEIIYLTDSYTARETSEGSTITHIVLPFKAKIYNEIYYGNLICNRMKNSKRQGELRECSQIDVFHYFIISLTLNL